MSTRDRPPPSVGSAFTESSYALMGVRTSPTRRWWRVTGWPLAWKITVVLSVPLAVAATLGGLRVHTALSEASAFSEMARGVQLLPQLVGLDNTTVIVAGTLAQRTLTEARGSVVLDQECLDALDEALALSRSLSGQAKAGPAEPKVLLEQQRPGPRCRT